VVKGWLDNDGETHERVNDLAVSGGRAIGADGRSKTPVGSTVDVMSATYDNSIGAAWLHTHWTDRDFDPSQKAFYYVRVLEIPTPRWTTIDAKVFGVKSPSCSRYDPGACLHLANLLYPITNGSWSYAIHRQPVVCFNRIL
jgi:hypothetical protein